MKDFYRIKISIDGPKEIQDKNRGKGTFRNAMAFLQALTKDGCKQVYLNPTFTRHNIPFLFDIAKWFLDTAQKYSIPKQHFELNVGDRLDWEEKDFDRYEKQLYLLFDWYEKLRDVQKDHFFLSGIEKAKMGEEPKFRHYFMACSAGVDAFAVSPHDEIFPCVTAVFVEASKRHPDLRSIPANSFCRQLTMKDDFNDCFECERYTCGPCPALFKQMTGDYKKIPDGYCRLGKLTNKIINQYLKEEGRHETENNERKAFGENTGP